MAVSRIGVLICRLYPAARSEVVGTCSDVRSDPRGGNRTAGHRCWDARVFVVGGDGLRSVCRVVQGIPKLGVDVRGREVTEFMGANTVFNFRRGTG